MKVVYIHRSTRSGGYSIEAIFGAIADELRKLGISVLEYELGSGWRMVRDIVPLWRFKADVYHVTGDVNYWIALLPKSKTVLTVHDIGHYLFGLTGWRKVAYKWLWLVLPMHWASQTTVVSDATRRDLVTHLHILPDGVKLIENCYNVDFSLGSKQFNKECPRILQIGTGTNKNVPRLIYALEGVNCTLDLIGKLNADIVSALQATCIPYANHFDISRAELMAHYAAADLVSFVSTSEGFGMPIIEAQAMGKPLITANLQPMSVVAGPEACLADPLDIASIRDGIDKLIHDDAFRSRIVESGLQNIIRYSASTVATRYLEVYQQLLQPA